MGVEDQKEEREVLDSIFPEEITGKLCANQILGALADSIYRCLRD